MRHDASMLHGAAGSQTEMAENGGNPWDVGEHPPKREPAPRTGISH
jgi:hypothetical protein